MPRGAGDSLGIEIERDFELDMLDVRGAIARPFRFHMIGLKRATPARERGIECVAIAKVNRQLIEKSRLVHCRDPTNRTSPPPSSRQGIGGPFFESPPPPPPP